MKCDQCQGLLSAWIDRHLDSADETQLEAHLRECADCRTLAEHSRALHADLVRAFETPRQAAARIAAQVLATLPPAPAVSTVPASRFAWPHWASMTVGMALGFLIAIPVFSPWRSQQVAPSDGQTSPGVAIATSPTVTAPVARLVLATGSQGIEFNNRSQNAWQPVDELANFQCQPEGSVRTNENVRCELVTSDGCVVRMNCDTEVVFHSPGQVEVKRGEIWCRSTPQSPLQVLPSLLPAVLQPQTPAGQIPAFTCEPGATTCLLSVTAGGDSVVVTAGEGKISVKSRAESVELQPNESACVSRERIDRSRSSDRLLAASWMQPLLVRKGPADPELGQRVADLLAEIGESKLSTLYEAEIRSLGEYSVLPLLRYVQSPRSASAPGRRQLAMQIACDLAPAWAIGDLVALLKHPDAEVRCLSATALERLTEQTQGIPLETWRGDPAEWEAAAAAWQDWWTNNRDRYPPAAGSFQQPLQSGA
jgi:hypothetical protein